MAGRYEDQIKDMLFSYSRITTYENCPYQFYLQYILKDKENYPPENNFYAKNGSAVHEAFEKMLKKIVTPEEAVEVYAELFNEIKEKVRESTMEKTFNMCLDAFESFGLEDFLEKYEIVGVESKLSTEINGIPFYGFLDVLLRDRSDGRLVLMDHKSAKPFFKKDGTVYATLKHQFNEYKDQACLYAKLVYDNYGEYPKEVIWNHFKHDCTFTKIPITEEEVEEKIKWFSETYKKLCEEEDFLPKQYLLHPNEYKDDSFFCTNLCNFRRSCEYINEYKKSRPSSKYKSKSKFKPKQKKRMR